jgi:hypothetical protein
LIERKPEMTTYLVVYKSYQKPGLEHFEVLAENKHDAKMKFLEANIKHDYIIKVII